MYKEKIVSAVKSGRILISDGGWGTFLYEKGLRPGECPELWCLDRPVEVSEIAEAYATAGADLIGTNSFGANRFKLERFGLEGSLSEINEAAARISRKAAGANKWVIASAGPTGKMLITEEITEDEMYGAFAAQAEAFEKGGADGICIETMSAIDEAVLAIRAAREKTALEIICTFTFEQTLRGDFRTMMGVSPAEAVAAAISAGADIIGTNCGNGMKRMIQIVREMRTVAADIPIMVQANAGLPVNKNGVDIFPDSPAEMALLVPEIIAAGANIIGGCCGTTPEHIRAFADCKY